MLEAILFAEQGICLRIGHIQTEDHTIQIEVSSHFSTSICPKCGQASNRMHSHYLRHPADLPIVIM